MITCQRCGKANESHYRYCLGCGALLENKPSTPAKVLPESAAPEVEKSEEAVTPVPDTELAPPSNQGVKSGTVTGQASRTATVEAPDSVQRPSQASVEISPQLSGVLENHAPAPSPMRPSAALPAVAAPGLTPPAQSRPCPAM